MHRKSQEENLNDLFLIGTNWRKDERGMFKGRKLSKKTVFPRALCLRRGTVLSIREKTKIRL